MNNFESIDTYLEHFGVKGMQWGVLKDKIISTRDGKKVADKIFDAKAANMKAKYGPHEDGKKPLLSDKQKSVLKGALVVGGIIGGFYVLNKVAEKSMNAQFLAHLPKDASTGFKVFWKDHLTVPHVKPLNQLSTVGVDLPPGSIIKRITASREAVIRPGGFYAAFKESDVERYKAALPVYWKRWQLRNIEGNVVSIVAKKGVKAPSPKETLELFNEYVKGKGKDSLMLADNYEDFYLFANRWINKEDVHVKGFFELVASRGYNALIDLNDAGGLAETPLRTLSSEDFEISTVVKLAESAIKVAQDSIKILAHFALLFGKTSTNIIHNNNINNYLKHIQFKKEYL